MKNALIFCIVKDDVLCSDEASAYQRKARSKKMSGKGKKPVKKENTGKKEIMQKPAKKKSRTVAGVLALLLGSFGIQKFYLGRYKTGILYCLFFWTGIPGILSTIEGVHILADDSEEERMLPENNIAAVPEQ